MLKLTFIVAALSLTACSALPTAPVVRAGSGGVAIDAYGTGSFCRFTSNNGQKPDCTFVFDQVLTK